ncbi:hypothetical protein BTB1458_2297 [Mycobacterium tuberculosis]|nr:hypothetical protein BTB1458_2297 [Mycobacterium tuberculosis]BAQ06127.1 hypothetical protein KURONO_2331 [Mycobacterium tuberculosis str. Kurono]
MRRPSTCCRKANWAGLGAMRQPGQNISVPETPQRVRISGT